MHKEAQKGVKGDTKFCTTLPQNNVPPPAKFCKTNTKNTTENTDKEYINLINQEDASAFDKANVIDVMDNYAQMIKMNIEYDALKCDMGEQNAMIDEIVELITETVCVKRDYIRIGGAAYPYQLVKGRLLKLNYSHICYVLDCMCKNTTKIMNIRAYLLTALFNAPSTMDSYYQAEVNHGLYGS